MPVFCVPVFWVLLVRVLLLWVLLFWVPVFWVLLVVTVFGAGLSTGMAAPEASAVIEACGPASELEGASELPP